MATVSKWGAEVRVQSNAYWGTTTALATGRFVTLYSVEDSQGESDIFAQYFNADGSKSGAAVRTHGTALDERGVVSAGLPDGGLIAAWTTFGKYWGDVYSQQFDAAGRRAGGEMFVNTVDDQNQMAASVATLSGGGFVIAYSSDVNTSHADDNVIRLQLFDSYGDPTGPERTVSPQWSTPRGTDDDPSIENSSGASVVGLSNGNFVVAWSDVTWDEYGDDVNLRGANVLVQVFKPDGTALAPEFWVAAPNETIRYNAGITALENGDFVAFYWQENLGLRARLFDADGDALTGSIRVSAGKHVVSGDAATLKDGRFVVTWLDNGKNFDRSDIRAKIFNADGSVSVAEFKVNTHKGDLGDASVDVLSDGRIVFSWSDLADSSKAGVYQQIFDPRIGAVELEGTRLAEQLIGTQLGDRIEGLGGADLLSGDGGDDTLVGGAGRDTMTGGGGADQFVFEARSDSRSGLRDAITDFQVAVTGEVIDLSGLFGGKLAWRGAGDFHGGHEVRYLYEGTHKTIVQINLNGDAFDTEVEIALVGHIALTKGDFVL